MAENPTPRMMWVWDDFPEHKVKHMVIYITKQNSCGCPVMTISSDELDYTSYGHCAELEEPKYRRMTNQEVAWWLRDNNRREYKRSRGASVSHEFAYLEAQADKEVRDVLIREDGGEWRDPLVGWKNE